jgi:KUP system potassium uptake protein
MSEDVLSAPSAAGSAEIHSSPVSDSLLLNIEELKDHTSRSPGEMAQDLGRRPQGTMRQPEVISAKWRHFPRRVSPSQVAGLWEKGRDELKSGRAAIGIAALGIVYGDIGTSPLYALNLLFLQSKNAVLTQAEIFGGISLVLWALTVVVTVKYASFVIRADYDGQGGVFALYGLLKQQGKSGKSLLSLLLLFGAGLLIGDGVITPAISVLSAVEGLSVAQASLASLVIPITLAILVGLFALQSRGTGKVGGVFGPIMLAWFTVLAVLGARQVVSHPEILKALNPVYGLQFLISGGLLRGLLILGAVMLVVTGGEAMYADLGHLGAKPIRRGWFVFVYPALVINYLGQGAFLLSGGGHGGGSLLFQMAPAGLIYPLVLLATLATIIASQSLISGTFSLVSQAIALEFLPKIRVVHTNTGHQGEVYVPLVNWSLLIACMAVVLTFRSSEALGAAYGLAVSGDMVTTSIAMYFVAVQIWGWRPNRAAALFGLFFCVDATFLVANSLKLFQGGYMPLTIGVSMFTVMATWSWGRTLTSEAYRAASSSKMADIIRAFKRSKSRLDQTVVLMTPPTVAITSEGDEVPAILEIYWRKTGIFPRRLILMQIDRVTAPYSNETRFEVIEIARSADSYILAVKLNYGFMEDANVPDAISELTQAYPYDFRSNTDQWFMNVGNEYIFRPDQMSIVPWLRLKLFEALRLASLPSYFHYGFKPSSQFSVHVIPVKLH